MMRSGLMPHPRSLLIVVGLASLLAWTAYQWFPPRRILVARLQRELEETEAGDLPSRFGQLARLGDEGLGALVHSLGSARPTVAAAAADVLQDQLKRWQTLPLDESSARVAKLAELLADRVEGFSPASRYAAGRMATKILLWPIDRGAVDGAELVLDCEVILRASTGGVAGRPAGAPEPVFTMSAVAAPTEVPGGVVAERHRPIPQVPAEPPRIVAIQPPVRKMVSPPQFSIQDQPPRPQPLRFRMPTALKPRSSIVARLAPPDRRPPRGDSGKTPHPVSRDLSMIDATSEAKRLEPLPDEAVMRALQSDSPARAHAALAELRRRGFRDGEIEVARRLYDQDPHVRAQLVDLLPGLPDIDPRPWLLRMTRDESTLVRRAAVGVLATSSDPVLRERLREVAHREADPEVLREVRRLLGETQHR